MLWAEADGVVRFVTDVAVRGIARALATEGQISAVAAAMFCLDPASVSMWACLWGRVCSGSVDLRAAEQIERP